MKFVLKIMVVLIALCAPLGAIAQDLPYKNLEIVTSSGPHSFEVEIADSDATRRKGLMHRAKMAPDAGMLFIYNKPRQITMWMKNTPLSLDMIFILPDGKVAGIAANTVPYSLDYIYSGLEVIGVLEVIAGTAKRIALKPGDKIAWK